MQEEDFEEDDGIYDDLNLDEQDAAFGRVGADDDGDESGSDTDGDSSLSYSLCSPWAKLTLSLGPAPQRSPVKETIKKSTREDKKDEVGGVFLPLALSY